MKRIHHLNCVEIESPNNGRAIGHCMLLESNEKLILVDTGIGLLDTKMPGERIGQELIDIVGFKFNEDWTAIKQIEKLGLDPGKVSDCIISHLDPDHIGGLIDFPDAKVHVAFEEYENFRSGNPRYLPHQLDHKPAIKLYTESSESWYGFKARKVDLGPGEEIYFVPLFGHTLGHCGIALKHQSQWFFYIGDAYYLRVELTDPEHPIHELTKIRADNNDLRVENLGKIRNFAKKYPDITIFGYHDFEEFTAGIEALT